MQIEKEDAYFSNKMLKHHLFFEQIMAAALVDSAIKPMLLSATLDCKVSVAQPLQNKVSLVPKQRQQSDCQGICTRELNQQT